MNPRRGLAFTVILLFVVAAALTLPPNLSGAQQPEFRGTWSSSFSRAVLKAPVTTTGPDPISSGALIVSTGFSWNRLLVYESVFEGGNTSGSDTSCRLRQDIPVRVGVTGVAVFDINGDRNLDIAISNFFDDSVVFYLQVEGGSFAWSQRLEVGDGPFEVVAGDFTGDGVTDLATANLYDHTISRLAGQGNGRFAPATKLAAPKALETSAVFGEQAMTGVDYTPLKTAIGNCNMSAYNEARLLRSVSRSENAYNKGLKRAALRGLELFIAKLDRTSDPGLSSAERTTLETLAADLINAIIGGGGGGVSVSLTPSPLSITAGGSSTLSWTSTGATSADIDNGIGRVAVNGSTPVTPAASTTYTITVTGPGGAATASATVTVAAAVDTIYVDASRGSDSSGTGTPDHPYKTITMGLGAAMGAALPGRSVDTKTVLAAAGTYDASNGETFPIVVPAAVILRGAGSNSTVISGGGAYTSASIGATNVGVVPGNASETGQVKIVNPGGHGVLAESVVASLLNSTVTACGSAGVAVTTTSQLTLDGCKLTDNGGSGAWVRNTARLNLVGSPNSFGNNGGNGIYMVSTAPNIVDGQSFTNDNVAIQTGAANVTVQNSTFYDDTGSSSAVVSLTSTSVIRGNHITGDFLYGVGSVGTSALLRDYSTIQNNYVEGATYGVWHKYSNGTTIGNELTNGSSRIANASARGVFSQLGAATITGNNIFEHGRGMRIESDASTISSNQFRDCFQGIQYTTSTSIVTGNLFERCDTGIFFFGSGAGTFSANTFVDSITYGVAISAGATVNPAFGPGGGNLFHNLSAGALANFQHCGTAAVNATGNTWDAWTYSSVCATTGVDIAASAPAGAGSVTY